jgi:uncharacterized membrane protein (DUF2068 family)
VSDPSAAQQPQPEKKDLALRLIMLEKAVKSVLVLTTAVVFAGMLVTGSSVHLHGMATSLREHAAAAWSVYVADAVVSVTERRHLAVATSALFLDGITTGLEWYALSRGRAWGEWLVVIAMSALIPFEVVSLVRGGHVGRFVILAGNVVIVLYLTRHAWKRHLARRAAASTS